MTSDRTGFTIAVLYFFIYGSFGAFITHVVYFLTLRGFDEVSAAALILVFPISCIFSSPISSLIADAQVGRKRVAQMSAFGAVVALVFLYMADSPIAICGSLALLAFIQVPLGPMIDATCLEYVQGKKIAYGALRMWGSIGFIVGTLVCGPMTDLYGSTGYILTNLVLVVLVALLIGWMPSGEFRAQGGVLRGVVGLLKTKGMPIFVVATVFHMIAAASFISTFEVHLRDLSFSRPSTVASWCWALGIAMEVIVFIYSITLMRRWSLRTLLIVSYGGGLVRWVLTAVVTDPVGLVAIQGLHGLVFGTFWIASLEFVDRVAPASLRTSAVGFLVATAFGIGNALGFLIHGPVYQRWLGPGVFLVAAGFSTLALIFGFWLPRNPVKLGESTGWKSPVSAE